MSHTPGPWSIHQYGIGAPITVNEGLPTERVFWEFSVGAGETLIGSVQGTTPIAGGYPRIDNRDEVEANANLIAAAPELLEALENLLRHADFIRRAFSIDASDREVTEAKAAILKARGDKL